VESLNLTRSQIRKISDIAADIGTVALASSVFPSILTKSINEATLSGIIITLLFWGISIIIRK